MIAATPQKANRDKSELILIKEKRDRCMPNPGLHQSRPLTSFAQPPTTNLDRSLNGVPLNPMRSSLASGLIVRIGFRLYLAADLPARLPNTTLECVDDLYLFFFIASVRASATCSVPSLSLLFSAIYGQMPDVITSPSLTTPVPAKVAPAK
jgi:hypothetical protein